jgi:hypothetical protein
MGRLTMPRPPADRATADREARLRRSLRRLGYDLVDDGSPFDSSAPAPVCRGSDARRASSAWTEARQLSHRASKLRSSSSPSSRRSPAEWSFKSFRMSRIAGTGRSFELCLMWA